MVGRSDLAAAPAKHAPALTGGCCDGRRGLISNPRLSNNAAMDEIFRSFPKLGEAANSSYTTLITGYRFEQNALNVRKAKNRGGFSFRWRAVSPFVPESHRRCCAQ
jgi:hypothetical protein